MSDILKRLAADEDGATMAEYVLMVALIGAALVTVVMTLGGSLGSLFSSVSSTVTGAGS